MTRKLVPGLIDINRAQCVRYFLLRIVESAVQWKAPRRMKGLLFNYYHMFIGGDTSDHRWRYELFSHAAIQTIFTLGACGSIDT